MPENPPPRRARRSPFGPTPWIARIGLVVLGLLLPLLLLEAALRVLGPFLPGNYRIGIINVSHPIYGRFHAANAAGWVRSAEFLERITTNSLGLRDSELEVPKPPETYRILAVGDSFLEGWGVSDGQVFAELLEQALNAHPPAGPPPRRYEVVNSGVSGWGPGNQYLWLKQEGLRLQPDVVMVHFFLGNDVSDNACDIVTAAAIHRVCFSLSREGRLRQQALRPRPSSAANVLSTPLRDHSLLFGMLEGGVLDRIQNGTEGNDQSDRTVLAQRRLHLDVYARSLQPRDEQRWEEAWQVVGALLGAIKRETELTGASLALAAIPSPIQIYPEDWERRAVEFGVERAQFDLERPNRRLAAIAQELGVPYLDLTPLLREEAASSSSRLYFRQDGHFTPEGHQVVARQLGAFLQVRNLLSP